MVDKVSGVLVVGEEGKLNEYKKELDKRGYGYITESVSDSGRALEVAKREDIHWEFCFVEEGEEGSGLSGLGEKLKTILRETPVYVISGSRINLYNDGQKVKGPYELNWFDNNPRGLIKRVLDDREDRIRLDGKLGGLGRVLRDQGHKGYQMETRILVVDDEQSIRELYSAFFGMKGYSVDSARDGVEALAMLRDPGCRFYRAILTDGEMPRLNGLGFIEQVRDKGLVSKDTRIFFASSDPGLIDTANTVRETLDITEVIEKTGSPSGVVNRVIGCLSGKL